MVALHVSHSCKPATARKTLASLSLISNKYPANEITNPHFQVTLAEYHGGKLCWVVSSVVIRQSRELLASHFNQLITESRWKWSWVWVFWRFWRSREWRTPGLKLLNWRSRCRRFPKAAPWSPNTATCWPCTTPEPWTTDTSSTQGMMTNLLFFNRFTLLSLVSYSLIHVHCPRRLPLSARCYNTFI